MSDVKGRDDPQYAFPDRDHIRPVDLRPICLEHGWPFDDYYRFVFIRNPWARMVSLYQMVRRHPKNFTFSFGEWLMSARPDGAGGTALFPNEPDCEWARYGTYSLDAFAGDGQGRRMVDDVFRVEDMWRIPDRLRARGIPIAADAMPWINRSREVPDLSQFYTPVLRAIVAQRYAGDIEEFGYSYPA